jgi:transcriptional regulator of acetoin/glycerol metabolism
MKSSLHTNHCICPICRGKADHPVKAIHQQINLIMSLKNARQRRLFAAFQAQQYGHGGITRVAEISGLDRKTIRKGIQELRMFLL